MAQRSPIFDDVDPGLVRALQAVGGSYGPHRVELFSGRSPRPKNPNSLHPQGKAVDVNLYDRESGKALPNIGDASSASAYQAYANEVYKWAQQNDPALAQELYWGGYFAGGGWPQDWMHFQRGGTKPAGGDWATGFTPEVMQKLGITQAGGLGEIDAQMQAAGYTPEQRRNAIAAIESAGSGDYKALGKWTGGNRGEERQADRAYGRYQVMGSNIGPWAEQYLKQAGVTPEQFLADPALQDKLFDAVYGSYVDQYGERGAASKWFTGSENEPARTDANGKLTGKSYADMYMEQLMRGGGGAAVASTDTGSTTPYTPPNPLPKKDKNTWAEDMGKAVAAMGGGGGGNFQYQVPPQPGAANVQAEAMPMTDPQAAEQQRQKLAALMQRLNSGALV